MKIYKHKLIRTTISALMVSSLILTMTPIQIKAQCLGDWTMLKDEQQCNCTVDWGKSWGCESFDGRYLNPYTYCYSKAQGDPGYKHCVNHWQKIGTRWQCETGYNWGNYALCLAALAGDGVACALECATIIGCTRVFCKQGV
jgi:hypothetical protein